jgi:DNA ligase 1
VYVIRYLVYASIADKRCQCFEENTKSFVLDAEAVAIDRITGKLMPFQELSKRKRKDVKVEDIQVRVCLFAFDLLYLNGEVRIILQSFNATLTSP